MSQAMPVLMVAMSTRVLRDEWCGQRRVRRDRAGGPPQHQGAAADPTPNRFANRYPCAVSAASSSASAGIVTEKDDM
jgi:hypothetical protein